jgi:hypothetical protein
VIVRWIIDERFKQYFTIRKKKDKKILPHQQWNLLMHFQGGQCKRTSKAWIKHVSLDLPTFFINQNHYLLFFNL